MMSTQDVAMFGYTASQGVFELMLPMSKVAMVPGETTVENIARHIARELKSEGRSTDIVEVRAYEGLHKGAVFRA